MENAGQRQHDKILAILFIFYGGAHLFAVSIVWLVLLALAGEGYYQMSDLKTLGPVGVSLLAVLAPLLSAYSLLRGRWWAKGVVVPTCLAIFMISLVVLIQVSRPRLSTNRVIFVIVYVGASMALCVYGIWFARKKGAV